MAVTVKTLCACCIDLGRDGFRNQCGAGDLQDEGAKSFQRSRQLDALRGTRVADQGEVFCIQPSPGEIFDLGRLAAGQTEHQCEHQQTQNHGYVAHACPLRIIVRLPAPLPFLRSCP